MKCKNKVEYKSYVNNGWNKTFEVICGNFGDGKKRFCTICKPIKENKE